MVASPPVAILDALYQGRRDEAERLLEERGADTLTVFEAAAMGVVSRLEVLLAADPTLANAFAPDGFQPLALAAFFGREGAVEVLLAHGADPSTPARNNQGVNALHAALAGPNPDITQKLVKAGADVNLAQQDGVRPLHEAAHIGRTDLVQLLLEHGADRDATDVKGRTAADFARERDHAAVLQVLG
jgi:uncharacterized protein